MEIGITEVFLLLGTFMAFFMSLVVAFRFSKNNLPANYFLVLFMIVIFLSLLLKLVDAIGVTRDFPHLLKINYPLGLLRPPLFFLYFLYMTNPEKKVDVKTFIHFLPFVALALYFAPYFILPEESKRIISTDPNLNSRWLLPWWYSAAGGIYSCLYLALSIRCYLRFEDFKSRLEPRYYSQLKTWFLILLVSYCLFVLTAISASFGPAWLRDYPFILLSFGVILGCGKMFSFPDLIVEEKKKVRSSLQSLSTESKLEQMDRIKKMIEMEQLFRRDDVRLSIMAEKTGLSESVVSGLVNELEGVTFTNFINRYRIAAAKEMLKNPKFDNLTVEGVGYDVGFSSRAAFYSAFKKDAGVSPAEFKKA
jgi:AraC-like DNA-binding protein